ncbi:cellulase/cellobiase CelA1 [Crossiella equi]|uniref:Glucanase n=1 Tax=Crossiella equi TaxID=130796 RepID=A0ABS5ASP9_9PSEU|nr:glycoside hydrolase family 6 protein [Crossiella equi]MBP2479583.1 cellulase/cellobiase CelA1 [Crossiella equi]
MSHRGKQCDRRGLALGAAVVLASTTCLMALAADPASAATACKVDYSVDDWGGGFTAKARSSNLREPISGWTLGFAFPGNQRLTPGARGLAAHLDEAVRQDAANGAKPLTVQLVVYNLPGRDCSALASNGELKAGEIGRYRTELIDPIAAILARPVYVKLRIVTVIEVDSLPNLVTNVSGRPTVVPQCDTMKANGNHVAGVGYALNKLGDVPNVHNYVDAGHLGWLGWDDNLGATVQVMWQAAAGEHQVDGLEPLRRRARLRQAFRARVAAQCFGQGVGMLIDTARNGWGGPNRPTQASTSTDPNTFVNQSRVDRRIHLGNWCNQAGAGLGERPKASPGPARPVSTPTCG